jgi:DNA (cytosine-5)-methyltransferase 1
MWTVMQTNIKRKGAVIITFKYIELFSGIGGFRSALDPLGGECVFASEIDKYATQAYKALYNGNGDSCSELHGDITKIDAHDIPDHDVLVGGFPCQAFSVAGQRKGFEEARGTLFFEIARIASAKQPRLMLLENVKGLLSHDGGKTFETMCVVLNDIGYVIDFAVLNSKHYGVPQNRERIFIVCSRDAEHAEWNVKGSGVVAKAKRRAADLGVRTFNFDWPTNDTVTTRLRDILESNVDERYYLSEEKTATLLKRLTDETLAKSAEQDVMLTDAGLSREIVARKDVTPPLRVGGGGDAPGIWLNESDSPIVFGSLEHYGNDQMNRVYSVDGVAPTITVVSGGGREQKIAEPIIEKIGHLPSDSGQTGAVYSADGIAPTILNQHGNAVTKIAEPLGEIDIVGYCKEGGYKANEAVYGGNGVISTLCARDYKDPKRILIEEVRAVLTPERPEKRQSGRRFKDDGEESFTLTAQDKHGIAIGNYPRYRIRKLTPRECWRLQGFTDAQHDTVADAGISDSQRYKQAGNAVTVNVISAIGSRMIPLLTKSNETKTEVSAL